MFDNFTVFVYCRLLKNIFAEFLLFLFSIRDIQYQNFREIQNYYASSLVKIWSIFLCFYLRALQLIKVLDLLNICPSCFADLRYCFYIKSDTFVNEMLMSVMSNKNYFCYFSDTTNILSFCILIAKTNKKCTS